jgi:hypothetical protein
MNCISCAVLGQHSTEVEQQRYFLIHPSRFDAIVAYWGYKDAPEVTTNLTTLVEERASGPYIPTIRARLATSLRHATIGSTHARSLAIPLRARAESFAG